MVKLSPGPISGWPDGLGIYRLRFSVEYATVARKEKLVARNFRAIVYVSRTPHDGRKLGFAWPESSWIVRTGLFTDARAILFEIDLLPDQVALIENLRAGGDLVFKLQFLCEVDSGIDLESGSVEVLFNVNKSAWVACMKQFGLDRIVLLEVELPTFGGKLKTAVDLLKRAREELSAGNYDGVVQKCRLAIDSAQKVFKLDGEIQAALTAFGPGGGKRAMTKRSRALVIAEAARHFSHPALHVDDEGATFDYGRRDAAFMLALASAIVSDSFGMDEKSGQ